MAAQRERREDGDGKIYAIIKVTSDLEDDDLQKFQFDFNNMRHEREMRDGELWLYVQYNAKNVTIRREGYGVVKQPLGFTVKAGATYRMKLSVQAPVLVQRVLQFKVTDNEGNPLEDAPIIRVKPEDSTDDYQYFGQVDKNGLVDNLIERGIYLYEVSANNYSSEAGRISLVSGNGTHLETVKLKPNFGMLEITNEIGTTTAEVFINNTKVGTLPYKSGRMECRDDYKLMIVDDLYKTYNSTFAIRLGETTKLSPRLENNFSEITLRVDADADIFVDGVKKGQKEWTGPLRAGVHNVECRKESHKSTLKQITVRLDEPATYKLDTPKRIEGTLYVKSNPNNAQVFVDGEKVGVTPCKVDNVLIGNRQVTVRLANYKDEVHEVNVPEGETETLSVTLTNEAVMTFNTTPLKAMLYINGEKKGLTPYSEEMISGDYDIKIKKRRYLTFHKTVHLDGSEPNHMYKLTRTIQKKNMFYIMPFGQTGSCLAAVGMSVGMYVHNINFEAYGLCNLVRDGLYANYIGTNPTEYSGGISSDFIGYNVGGRAGYGFAVTKSIRMTPQLGTGVMMFLGSGGADGYALTGSIGIKTDFGLTHHFGLTITPEYNCALKKSEVYKQAARLSREIKGWTQGLNVRLGFNIFF